MNLNGKSFLTLLDFTPDEITGLLDLAAALKAKKKAGVPHDTLRGKNIALIFEKTSTRTRCSFEVAAHDLGMHVTYLDPTGSQIGKKESIADTARVLGRLYDGIEYRGFGQSIVEELAKYAGVPVWNGLTNEFHPTQILADMLTIREHFGSLKGRKLVFLGDCRYNMANSLMIGCAKLGMHFVASGPEGYFPDPALIARCEAIAAETGATLAFETDPAKAVAGADVLYTLGLHGRADGSLGRASGEDAPLSGQSEAHGRRRRKGPVHALPACVPRPQHRHWPPDRRAVPS